MFCSAVAGPIRCWVDVPPIKWAHCNETALGTWTRPMHGRQRVCVCVCVCVCVWEVVEITWSHPGYWLFGFWLCATSSYVKVGTWKNGTFLCYILTQAHLHFNELLTANLRWRPGPDIHQYVTFLCLCCCQYFYARKHLHVVYRATPIIQKRSYIFVPHTHSGWREK